VFVSCVQKQLQEYDFQFSAWPTDFDVADVEGYVLFITRSVFRIRTGYGFNQVRGSGSGIRIRIQEGKNYPQKYKKLRIVMVTGDGPRLVTSYNMVYISSREKSPLKA
jgi:hypothetical protein